MICVNNNYWVLFDPPFFFFTVAYFISVNYIIRCLNNGRQYETNQEKYEYSLHFSDLWELKTKALEKLSGMFDGTTIQLVHLLIFE